MLVGIRDELLYEVKKLVKKHGLSYIDAVLHYCDINNLDPEYVGSIVSKHPALKDKLTLEAESLNFIEKEDRLPI
jgi:hypothetical protein